MGEQTGISWADHTWSPWYGCTQVSMGEQGACVGCYARQLSETRMHRVVFGGPGRGIGTRDVRADSAWAEPLRWNRTTPGAFIFPSMCDPFDNHPALREPRARFLRLIRATPHLTWLLLTKRPQNIERLYADACLDDPQWLGEPWPRNAAIGCTVVTQAEADRDIPHLLSAKAALKPAFAFLSMEPLLGPVNVEPWLNPDETCEGCDDGQEGARNRCSYLDIPRHEQCPKNRAVITVTEGERDAEGVPDWVGCTYERVDWVITGGETDQGAHKARPTDLAWFRSLRDHCQAAGVPFHFKQMTRKGQIPDDLLIRQMPHAG